MHGKRHPWGGIRTEGGMHGERDAWRATGIEKGVHDTGNAMAGGIRGEHVPTEFWWCRGRVLLSGLWYGARCY